MTSACKVSNGAIQHNERRDTFVQHYFDERGVARVYEMKLGGGIWNLERTKPDFSPFEFSQRFTGTFSKDVKRIEGTWEIAHDHTTWEKDFDLIYTRVQPKRAEPMRHDAAIDCRARLGEGQACGSPTACASGLGCLKADGGSAVCEPVGVAVGDAGAE